MSKFTRLNRESDPPAGKLASPTPQYWDRETEKPEDVEGLKGAPFAMLLGPNGEPIDDGNPLEARVRHLEALIGPLDATKQTDPDAASAALLALVRGQLAATATLKAEVDKLTALISDSRLKTEATLTGSVVPDEQAMPVRLMGHIQEFAVSSWDEIAPDEVPAGSVAILIGTSDIRQTDGKEWLPI